MQIKKFEINGEITEELTKEIESFLNEHPENSLWVTFESMFGFDNLHDGLVCYRDLIGILEDRVNAIGLKTIIVMDSTREEGNKEVSIKFFDSEPEIKAEFID